MAPWPGNHRIQPRDRAGACAPRLRPGKGENRRRRHHRNRQNDQTAIPCFLTLLARRRLSQAHGRPPHPYRARPAPESRLHATSKRWMRRSACWSHDMADSMYAADGIGLAAVQIGVPKRVIVMDLDQKRRQRRTPARLHQSQDPLGLGGNGGFRGRLPVGAGNLGRCRTPRPHQAEYLDLDGKRIELEADGMLATCLQHEMDHLEGRAVHRPSVPAEARHGCSRS